MFPGVILQMCYWYRPDEMSVRLLYFCQSQIYPQALLKLRANSSQMSSVTSQESSAAS
jgi:hypothetical protein